MSPPLFRFNSRELISRAAAAHPDYVNADPFPHVVKLPVWDRAPRSPKGDGGGEGHDKNLTHQKDDMH